MSVRYIRLATAALGLLNCWWGAWARLDPRGFFDDFPGFGQHWVATYPPYNVHLVTDLGASLLTVGVLLLLGAAVEDRRVRALSLAGVLVFNSVHLSFHATDAGTMNSAEIGWSTAALVGGVVVPAVLLALDWWARPRGEGEPGAD